jgi:membrane protein
MSLFSNPMATVEEFLWSDRLERSGKAGRVVAVWLRYLYAMLRDFSADQLTFRAMSLVYTTLLSIVPLVAVSFAMAKGLGMFDALRDVFLSSFTQLGPDGEKIAENMLGMADRISGRAIGAVGVVFFLWTAVSMVQKVEASFNYVWQVKHPRGLGRRLSEYLVVLVVGPVIMATALSIIASLSSNSVVTYLEQLPFVPAILLVAGKFLPYLLITGVFTFLYVFIPNARVRPGSALVGGLAAGIVWASTSFLFTTFVATSFKTFAVYASFGVGIVALLWLYLNWLILLLGAQLAFYHQNPVFLRFGRDLPPLAGATRECLALAIMVRTGQCFRTAGDSVSLQQIGAEHAVPMQLLEPIARALEAAGLLVRTDRGELVPGRDMTRILLRDVLDTVRLPRAKAGVAAPGERFEPVVDGVGASLEAAVSAVLADRTLADLVDQVSVAAGGPGGGLSPGGTPSPVRPVA